MAFKLAGIILLVLVLAGVAGVLTGICWLFSRVSDGTAKGVEKLVGVMNELIAKTKIGGSKNEQ